MTLEWKYQTRDWFNLLRQLEKIREIRLVFSGVFIVSRKDPSAMEKIGTRTMVWEEAVITMEEIESIEELEGKKLNNRTRRIITWKRCGLGKLIVLM